MKSDDKKEHKTGKADYGIGWKTFVFVWETSRTVDEVYERLAEISRKLGRPPMSRPIIIARAATYRKIPGCTIKKMDLGRPKAITKDEINDFIEQVRSNPAMEVPVEGEPAAAPPRPRATVEDRKKAFDSLVKGKKRPTK